MWSAVQKDHGGDFALYCAAVRVADAGGNPFDLDADKNSGAPLGIG